MIRATVLAALLGCQQPVLFGPPTQARCPTGSPLTYASFGQPFMEAYCTRCHASTLHGAQRMGAPSFHDFDTLYGIKAVPDHIDETTAAGPAATNTAMPPGGPAPSAAERAQLGEWLACRTPE